MKLAPIGISTYSRLNHLTQTIEALKKNSLASESELYVFSDAPKADDEEKVKAVRTYLKNINGFKRIEIIERQTNSRTYNNRQGMRMMLDRHDKMIFMEEDIVTAPSFLEYMNFALDAYENNSTIFSITGHCPPIHIPADYPYDVFLHPRFDPWGFGIWKDRFDMIEMKIPQRITRQVYLNPKKLYKFSKGGLDLLPLVLNNYFEYADGLDVRIFPQQFIMNMLTVYPVKHLVKNIGLDGSGVHPKKNPKYKIDLWEGRFQKISLPIDLNPNYEIMKSVYKFKSGSYWNRFRQIAWLILIILRKTLVFEKKATKAN